MEDQGCTGKTDAGGGDPHIPSTAIRKINTQRLHEILRHKVNLWASRERLQQERLWPRRDFWGSIINTGTSTVSQHPVSLQLSTVITNQAVSKLEL